MKMKSYLIGMSVLALLSCNSSPEPEFVDPRWIDPEEEIFPVKFSLLLKEEVFSFPETRGIPPLNVAEPLGVLRGDEPKTLNELCCQIEYIVFKDGETTPYRNLTYTQEDLEFGTLSDALPRGEYEIVVVAHNSSSVEVRGDALAFDRVTDTFHHAFYLEVAPGDRHEETITLYRVVSKIEFVSTDIVPENAKEFTIRLDKHPCLLDLSTGRGLLPEEQAPLFTYPLTDHIGSTNLTHAFFTFVQEGGTSLVANLKAMDTADGVLRERTVENIQPILNKIIRYKGRLYNSAHSDDEFTIILDENGEWGETVETDIGD